RVACKAGSLFVYVGNGSVGRDGEQRVGGGFDQRPVGGLLLGQLPAEPRLFGEIARRGENSLYLTVRCAENRGVKRNGGFASGLGLQNEFVVWAGRLGESALDAQIRPVGLREVLLEDRADQFLARITRHAAHLLIHVGDETRGVYRNQPVDRTFNQAAQINLLLAQLLLQPDSVGDIARGREDPANVAQGIAE